MIKDQSTFFIEELFSWNCNWSLDLTETVLHSFDHQTKPSILVLYYFCKSFYRSACIVVTVFFICFKTSTAFLNYWGVIRGTVGLNWWFAYCEVQCEAVIGYTVGSV